MCSPLAVAPRQLCTFAKTAKAVLLMQSSGAGNCINMLSLTANGQFPFLCFVTMRGTFGEQNAWQVPMGKAVRPALESIGVDCLEV